MSAPTTPADPDQPERAADGAAPTPDATPTTPVTPAAEHPAPAPAPAAAQAVPPAPAPSPSRTPRALAIAGIAVGGLLLLAVTFGAGTLVGRYLPGPGPVGLAGAVERGGPFGGERVGPGERGDRLGALTEEQREQIREWIEEGMAG
ncbi:hypothetical protein OVN20_04170 [Microcella daejeonensis]|uniref:hypothetical protein n=1 Tax=Microcella daejeonensis TaxID=2994971 RepID=UPI0022703D74|nr:hypothetical protein [Microcella daejeonensis]WAB84768.1 hypothetical protein OVN20_04170 [Microcella daejeonensis]